MLSSATHVPGEGPSKFNQFIGFLNNLYVVLAIAFEIVSVLWAKILISTISAYCCESIVFHPFLRLLYC